MRAASSFSATRRCGCPRPRAPDLRGRTDRQRDGLSERDDAVDLEVRALHLDLLKQAHAARSELLAALGPALRDLLDALEGP